MELKTSKNKIKAITLVELIIALTMVSVLMLMVFGVIFKKTKASIMTPSGTFYCWKDWNGKLHQRCYSSGGNGVCKGFTNTDEDVGGESDRYCLLNFPELLTKDVTNIKAYIIGGGAAGTWYKPDDISVEYACNDESFGNCKNINNSRIISEIRKGIDCFNPLNNEIKCVNYSNEFQLPPDVRINESNYIKPILKHCMVSLYEGDPRSSKINTYLFEHKDSYIDSYYYDKRADSTECVSVGYKYPFLYARRNAQFITLSNDKLFNVDSDIKYKVSNAIKYTIKMPKPQKNKFISADIKFDTNKPLKIEAKDIGNPGNVKNGGDGSGGDTILKSNFNDETVTAKGTPYIQVTDSKDLNKNIEKYNQKISFRFCCDGTKQNPDCNFGYQDTGLNKYITLNNPELPNINQCKNLTSYTNIDGKNNIGFGLFGYHGFSSDSEFEYAPFTKIKLLTHYVRDIEFSDKAKLKNPPGNGMGGAIIIQWN